MPGNQRSNIKESNKAIIFRHNMAGNFPINDFSEDGHGYRYQLSVISYQLLVNRYPLIVISNKFNKAIAVFLIYDSPLTDNG